MNKSLCRLTGAIAALKDSAKVEAFLREILTPNEFHDLALRWELVELLAAGVSQRNISARLGISLCKITRGAKILKSKKSVVAEFVRKAAARPASKSAPKPKCAPKPAKPKKAVKHGTRVPVKPKNKVRR